MSYREENGQVTLTMTREDYDRVLMMLGAATATFSLNGGPINTKQCLALVNRLNEGNPNYTPYKLAEKTP